MNTPETDAMATMQRTTKEWREHSEKLETERDNLRDAVRAYRDAKGRYHTQLACEHLLTLLPESKP